MTKDFILIKTPNGFSFATDADKEKASSWKMGKPLRCEIKESIIDRIKSVKDDA